MTTEHKALKAQFDAGLKKAKESDVKQQHVAEENIKVMPLDEVRNNMPWMRALAMEQELLAKQHRMSSVWIYFLCTIISPLTSPTGICDLECISGMGATTLRHMCNDISDLFQDFSQGVEIMKNTKITQINGEDMITGGPVKLFTPCCCSLSHQALTGNPGSK